MVFEGEAMKKRHISFTKAFDFVDINLKKLNLYCVTPEHISFYIHLT